VRLARRRRIASSSFLLDSERGAPVFVFVVLVSRFADMMEQAPLFLLLGIQTATTLT
jgi:hypothetical protein